MWLALES